ncbi:hypothetical protein AACH06_17030 [Ideonella sp. DXS29W]|uniref:Immunity protein 72 domain-containing protein n=1 Tax=Ideonella lacteola TaxID=2984193 RepID=A0ABU9BRE1_9BURK
MTMQRDLSREANLWYTITSAEYLDHAQRLLQEAHDLFMRALSRAPNAADYAPVPVWGQAIKDLLIQYPHARRMLAAGDYSGMIAFEGGLGRIPRGIAEGNISWMGLNANAFMEIIDAAASIADTFWRAVTMSKMYGDSAYRSGSSQWRVDLPRDMGIPSNEILRYYEESVYKTIGRPKEIPEYVADRTKICRTGDLVPWTGVWVPGAGMGTAALVFARQGLQVMQPAYEVALLSDDGEDIDEFQLNETQWHPVVQSGRLMPLPPAEEKADTDWNHAGGAARCEALRPCPREGWWVTPAKADSRRRFQLGELMPEVGGDYGATIWQWDERQSDS